MNAATVSTDPVALLRDLTAEKITERLDAVEAEARALRVLLRSARARETAKRRIYARAEETRRAD